MLLQILSEEILLTFRKRTQMSPIRYNNCSKEVAAFYARSSYYSVKQKKNESIHNFLFRFERLYEAFVFYNERELPEDEIATDFLMNLNENTMNLD